MTQINAHYKDRLFAALFGNSDRKELTLDLYNALNNTHYTNPDDIQLNMLDDVVYMGMRNDVSFLLANDLNMYEQQSSWNPNMPLRQFCYAAHAIEAYLKETEMDSLVYGNVLVKIPAPKLVVLYNGTRNRKDTELRLSDCFEHEGGDLEAVVHVYNINPGSRLPMSCSPLNDYSIFVDVYRNIAGGSKDRALQIKAANAALAMLPDGPVKRYISAQKGQVINMLLTEYDAQKTMDAIAKQEHKLGVAEGEVKGRTEGRAEGKEEGKQLTKDAYKRLAEAMKNGGYSSDDLVRIMLDEAFCNEMMQKFDIS